MSISSLDLINQTTLVPNTLLGYATDGVSAIEILPTSITIAGNLTTTPIYVGISASTGLTTNRPNGLDVNCDFDMNGNDITELDILKFDNTGIDISDQATDAQISSNNSGQLFLTCSNDLKLDVNNASIIELTPTNLNITGDINPLNITGNGGIDLISNNTGINITANADDITIINNANGIFVNSNGNIGLTSSTGQINIASTIDNLALVAGVNASINATDNITLTTTSVDITLQSGGLINLNSGGDITLQTGGGGVISINSNDNTQVNCGENFFVQTNGTTGLVQFTTGDLANSGGIRWNTYPMSITFFNKWTGYFNYNNPNAWEIINPTNPINFPSQFLHSTWAVQFSLNCWDFGSAPNDKELAFYIDFLDGNSNTYTGFNYKQPTPFANWFNPSNYTTTAQEPLSITYTDYFDFTNAVNNLELRLNWYGNQSYPQNFNLSTTFTLMTLI